MSRNDKRVVITGVGLISPLGHTARELWKRIVAGETSARAWPDLEAEGHRIAWACRIADLECEPLRRGRQLALIAARRAVECARLQLPWDTGVFVGSTLGESLAFERVAAGERLPLRDYSARSFVRSIQDEFQLSGPAQSVVTACAAGNYAVGGALECLRQGRATVALAGGAEPFSRLAMVGFARSRAMAANACRPFDRNRSGMLLGEGAAMFVLETVEHALDRGATPLAEPVALGLSCDAYHPTAPLPDGSGMRRAMQSALSAAGIGPSEVDWINVHGTGTRASDAAEAKALRALFGDELPEVSGSKGALGHALGAASALELALCITGIAEQAVPPTAGHEVPDDDGVHLTRKTVSRPVRWVLNNAFAFGGVNSALLLRGWGN
jgi:3-oxoacyl-[acyl-carrier-protein] synthase II